MELLPYSNPNSMLRRGISYGDVGQPQGDGLPPLSMSPPPEDKLTASLLQQILSTEPAPGKESYDKALDAYAQAANAPAAAPPAVKELPWPNMTLSPMPAAQKPRLNALSLLASGLFGLAAPQAAGEFGAAALGGSMQEAERQRQEGLSNYEMQYQQAYRKHLDDIERTKAQERVDLENAQRGWQGSLAEQKRKMDAAKEIADLSSSDYHDRLQAWERGKEHRLTAATTLAKIEETKVDREALRQTQKELQELKGAQALGRVGVRETAADTRLKETLTSREGTAGKQIESREKVAGMQIAGRRSTVASQQSGAMARAVQRAQQTGKIPGGLPPELRGALQTFKAVERAHYAAQKIRLDHMASVTAGGKKLNENDPTYKRLTAEAEAAAKQYQYADKVLKAVTKRAQDRYAGGKAQGATPIDPTIGDISGLKIQPKTFQKDDPLGVLR